MSEPVTVEEMETWAAGNERHGQNLTARYLRAGAAALRERDAGWAAAEALFAVARNYAHYTDVFNVVHWNKPLFDACGAFLTAKAKRNPNSEI